MIEDKKVLSKLMERIEENKAVATVTIVDVDGSTPRSAGSTMLVDENGNILEGTIGGGVLEVEARKEAANCIKNKKSKLASYNVGSSSGSKDDENVLPDICGGRATVFIKVFNSQERIIIAGAGHVGESIAKIAKILGYYIIVLDEREERLTGRLFPDADELILEKPAEKLKGIDIDENTYIIIVTHGHKFDQECLESVIRSNAGYIGMIGSKNKTNTVFDNLLGKGYTEEELSRVYAPIGLDLGGETPEEIALGVMAEIQVVKNNKKAYHLSINKR